MGEYAQDTLKRGENLQYRGNIKNNTIAHTLIFKLI